MFKGQKEEKEVTKKKPKNEKPVEQKENQNNLMS